MSTKEMASVILFDREDVSHFPTTRPYAAAFALTPSALEAAQANGIPQINDSGSFSLTGHARCAAAAKRAVLDFNRAVAGSGLPTSIVVMARQSVWGHAALVHRLKLSLPPAPWIVRRSTGDWFEARDWEALHQAFLPRVWDSGLAHRITAARPPFSCLFNWLTRLAAWAAKRRAGPWIASSSHKLKNGLQQGRLATAANLAVFKPTEGGWKDYRALFGAIRNKKSLQTFRLPPLASDHPEVKAALHALHRIGSEFSDLLVRSAWQTYAPYLARTVPAMLGIVTEGPQVLGAIGARTTVSYEANSWLAASLMEAAGRAGITRVVFNHNSHRLSGSPIADSILDMLLRQRTWNDLTDVAAVWSPFSMHALRALSTTDQQSRMLPIRLAYPASVTTPGGKRPIRILHAGNYQNWSDFFPWVAETADEYLIGLEHLAATVEKMDGVELLVRVRPKLEVDVPTVERSLGNRRNVTVCGTEQEFLEQLAESDLLVAHFSTTVEQALQMGKPVLLWGSTDRYQQFPGRETPPEGRLADRVYVVRRVDALPAMLAGIRDAIQTSGDVEPWGSTYSFEAGTPDVAHLASFLIDPGPINQGVHK